MPRFLVHLFGPGIARLYIFACLAVGAAALVTYRDQVPLAWQRIDPSITPQEAMRAGCCVYEVWMPRTRSHDGRYEIVTLAGRHPADTGGDIVLGQDLRFFVGEDWVGYVRLEPARCAPVQTAIMGGPYGRPKDRPELLSNNCWR